MRIGDAVNFSAEQLDGNRVFLYTLKTGVAVNTVLPDFVVSALAAIPRVTDKLKTREHCAELADSFA